MSKVTGKDLESLIERVALTGLRDKIYMQKKADYDTKEPDIEDLAQNDADDTTISQNDVTKAFADDDQAEKDAASFLGGGIKRSKPESEKILTYLANATTDAAEFTAGDIQTIDSEKIRSIAFKQLQTVSADPDEPSAMGQFPEGIGTAMNVVFSGVGTFRARLERLAEVCEQAISNVGTVSQGDTPTNAIANMLILDYVSTLVREIDSGAGAYNFEALLAMLTGGRVVGKETTPEGQMGGADFKSADGSAGSSKYYGRLSGIDQSAKGFTVNEPVFYVIAIKQSEDGTTSDPRKITSLNIYTLSVIKLAENVNGKDVFAYKYSNSDVVVNAIEAGGRINLSAGLSSKGDPLNIRLVTSGNQRDIRRVVDAITREREDSVALALEQFKTLSSNLYTANEKSQAYASTGDIEKGNEALGNLQAADKAMIELAKIIAGEEKVDTDTRKITQEHILKLIEESFKK
tara:strand:+ start:103 stop:1488 length:1386 start_codon:yes stop_codon:yes gene_type:complete